MRVRRKVRTEYLSDAVVGRAVEIRKENFGQTVPSSTDVWVMYSVSGRGKNGLSFASFMQLSFMERHENDVAVTLRIFDVCESVFCCFRCTRPCWTNTVSQTTCFQDCSAGENSCPLSRCLACTIRRAAKYGSRLRWNSTKSG